MSEGTFSKSAKEYEDEAAKLMTSDLVLAIVHFEIAKHADETDTCRLNWTAVDRARAYAAAVELDLRLRPRTT